MDGREGVQRVTGRDAAHHIMPPEGMPFFAATLPRWGFSRITREHFDSAGMLYCADETPI